MTEAKARLLVYARSGGICERCSQARGVEWQHRKNRSQGGLWAPENGLHLCSPCHRYVHHNVAESQDYGWSVKSCFDPATRPVLVQNLSRWVYLDAYGDYVDFPPAVSA